MGRGLGGGWGDERAAAETVQHQVNHVALAPLEVVGSLELDAHRRGDGARVDQGKPAERDDAEQQLSRLARRRSRRDRAPR